MTDIKNLTLCALLDNSAKLYPNNQALAYVGQKPYTYLDVYEKTKKLQTLLYKKGIKKGDRVALLGPNMPQWGISYLAISGMGAVVVPILTDFSSNEIIKILEHSKTCAIIISEKYFEIFKDNFPESIHTAVLLENFKEINIFALNIEGKVLISEEDQQSDHNPDKECIPEESDLAAILYTSGTTGNPKGVMLSHANIMSNAVNTLQIQNVTENDRLLSVLPLSHTYECTIGFLIPFMKGASIYYLNKPPTASVLLPALKLVRPTMMLTVPLIMEKIYKLQVLPKLTSNKVLKTLNKARFVNKLLHKLAGRKIYKAFGGKLHFFGIGGAKISPVVEQFLRDAKFPYAIGYGLTETSPLLAGCSPSITKFQSTGLCLPNQKIKINNPNPETGEGEIVAKGPNIMQGYYKDPEKTAEVFTDDGWFKTGDLGNIDNEGYLYIRGRLKNMILGPGGENIYPEEIEDVINSQNFVLESVVYEHKGKLVAKVHLNYEEIEMRYQNIKESAQNYKENIQNIVKQYLAEIQENVNSNISKFSHINLVVEQPKPFEKTPTKKIKRFLYQY